MKQKITVTIDGDFRDQKELDKVTERLNIYLKWWKNEFKKSTDLTFEITGI